MASLCRAISSTYYAVFHCLAYESANLLIGGSKTLRSDAAWRQVYRSLEHGLAKAKCKNTRIIGQFPAAIIDFADCFVSMQERRHAADYDPFFRVGKSQVRADIAYSRVAIANFIACQAKDKRAFCAYVLLKDRI